jgi:chitinase
LGYLIKSVSGTYTQGGKGLVRYWNSAAKVPYLYNPSTGVSITYDDEASIREKNKYVKSKGLRGAMLWELNADKNKVLLPVVASELPH